MQFSAILKVIFYSASLIPIWGLMMLDSNFQNNFGVFICLLYSVGLSIYVKSNFYEKLKKLPFYFLLIPFSYLVAFIFTHNVEISIVYNPLFCSFIFLLWGFYFIKPVKSWSIFFVIFFAYLYAFYGYFYFKNETNYVKDLTTSVEKRYLNENVNIKNYLFLNSNQEETKINSDKLILVETWNESCPPCIKSINDLQPTIDSLSGKFKHVYLYESPLFGKTVSFEDVIGFKPIQNKEKIFIDFHFKFFKDIGMKSYPVFLLFNRDGVLLDYFTGYSSENKDYFKKRIEGMSKK